MVHVLLKPGLENSEHYFTFTNYKDFPFMSEVQAIRNEHGVDMWTQGQALLAGTAIHCYQAQLSTDCLEPQASLQKQGGHDDTAVPVHNASNMPGPTRIWE